jgi:uncharacterized protein YegL
MPHPRIFLWCLLLPVCTILFAGCKKSASQDTGLGEAKPVVMSITDISPKGDFNEQALRKIDAESSTPAIAIIVSRTRINDAALVQLAKYKNIRRVQAIGSPLSDAAIERLQAALPGLTVKK